MSLKYSILAVLSEEERTGYDITRKMDQSVGFFWAATHQQIYKELAALEKQGLVKHQKVKQEAKPDKKVFHITPKGREDLIQWIGEPTEGTAPKDTLLVKLFVGNLVPAKTLCKELMRHYEIHSKTHQKYLEIERKYFSNLDELSPALKFQYLTLRRGITFEESWLGWARECIELLEKS